MGFYVIQPPKEEAKLAEVGKEIVQACAKFGRKLDTQGFLFSWIGGTRVVVERDDSSNEITSIAMVATGKRWIADDTTASVLFIEGDRAAMIEFIKTVCNALGASSLFIEETEPLETTPAFRRLVVQEIKLQ